MRRSHFGFWPVWCAVMGFTCPVLFFCSEVLYWFLQGRMWYVLWFTTTAFLSAPLCHGVEFGVTSESSRKSRPWQYCTFQGMDSLLCAAEPDGFCDYKPREIMAWRTADQANISSAEDAVYFSEHIWNKNGLRCSFEKLMWIIILFFVFF